jgi:hypothetical protein
MYGVGISLKRGSGKAMCQLCRTLIGKNQPCIHIAAEMKKQGYIHGIANECQAMIYAFGLKV